MTSFMSLVSGGLLWLQVFMVVQQIILVKQTSIVDREQMWHSSCEMISRDRMNFHILRHFESQIGFHQTGKFCNFIL